MKQVKMLRDEVVSWGPQRLIKDQTAELPDGLAASLVGRGLAVYSEQPESVTGDDVTLSDVVDLNSLTVAVLKEMAEAEGITGYQTMKKARLIEVLGG